MTPEEHFFCALMALEMTPGEKQEFVAEFRRSLIEHDTRVLEDFLYGSDAAPSFALRYPGTAASVVLSELRVANEIPAFAAMSTCSRCEEEHPTDDDEWCEACLRVGGSV